MEYRMKCKVCGKIFCYTDQDLKENSTNSGLAAIESVGALASIFGGGTIFHTQYLQGQANRHSDKIVDFNRCPYCHSNNISDYFGEVEELPTVEAPSAKTVNINGSATTEALLKRAFMFLEDGEWSSADSYLEACLDKEPELAEAYLGKLMVERKAHSIDELAYDASLLPKSKNYLKVIRYGTPELEKVLTDLSERANIVGEQLYEVRSKFNDPNCSVNLILVSGGTAALCGDDSVKVFGWNPGSAFKRENVKAVAGNFFYIAELCTNGTVVVGKEDHSFKVADWQGITAINAEAGGLTGLRADGTAVAYELLESKKCDIDQWSDVAYAVYDEVVGVFGVCKNGDVIYNGKYGDRWRYVTEAKNVARIKILDFLSPPIVIFYADGSAELINSGDKQAEAKWSDAVDVVSGSYGTLLILQSDGNAFSYKLRGTTAGPNMKINWTDIVSICYTHSNYFVGLKSDGTVKAEYMGDDEFSKYKGQCDVSDWSNIIAVYSYLDLTVGVRADGSIVYCGEAKFTKSNPDWNLGWKLFDGVKDLEENIKRNKEFKASMERAAEEQREARKRAAEEARLARIAELEKEKEALQAEIPTIKGLFAAGKIKKLQARVDEIETELTKLK